MEALEFAALALELRKEGLSPQGIPYITHPAAVGLILTRAGMDEEVIIAGILHDVIEDTDKTHADIAASFGKRVADLVAEESEDPSLPYAEMKEGSTSSG